MSSDTRLRVGEVADAAGVHVQTLHYYERRGLLPEPGRTAAGYRIYQPGTVRAVRAIKRAQRLGFSLADVQKLMMPGCPPRARRDMFARKLEEIDRQIDDLRERKRSLEEGAKRCGCGGELPRCDLLSGLTLNSAKAPTTTTARG